jgi:hypothetical protein
MSGKYGRLCLPLAQPQQIETSQVMEPLLSLQDLLPLLVEQMQELNCP